MMSNWGKKPTGSTATPKLKEAVKTEATRKMTFMIHESLHQKFKIYAAQENTTMADLLNTYIRLAVEK